MLGRGEAAFLTRHCHGIAGDPQELLGIFKPQIPQVGRKGDPHLTAEEGAEARDREMHLPGHLGLGKRSAEAALDVPDGKANGRGGGRGGVGGGKNTEVL